MAYASKELKNKVNNLVKDIVKEMGIKMSFSIKIENHSKLILNIRSCSIDLEKEYRDEIEKQLAYYEENPHLKECKKYERLSFLNYTLESYNELRYNCNKPEEVFHGKSCELLKKIVEAVKCEYYNDSDAMRDYFDIAYYYDVRIGDSAKGFTVV